MVSTGFCWPSQVRFHALGAPLWSSIAQTPRSQSSVQDKEHASDFQKICNHTLNCDLQFEPLISSYSRSRDRVMIT